MQTKKQGFTLIELLVVVLIIGILSAVAIVKYKEAVEKVELTELIMLSRDVAKSAERYYLASGVMLGGNTTGIGSFDNLDIKLNLGRVVVNVTRVMAYLPDKPMYGISLVSDGTVEAGTTSNQNYPVFIYNYVNYPGYIACYARTNSPNAKRRCQIAGGIFQRTQANIASDIYAIR